LTAHLHSKLNRCTDSPRPPGVDPRPARSKHELSPLIMRRHSSSHEEGAETHSRSLSHGSSTMRGAPFTSSSLRDKGDAHSCAEFWARRSFDATRPVPRNPVKVKHFAILENIHLDSLSKRRPATSHHPDGRAPPGDMATLSEKPRTASDSSGLLYLDRHRRTIVERKQIKRQRRANLVTSLVQALGQSTIHISKTQEPS
jgi:hypothetical protein